MTKIHDHAFDIISINLDVMPISTVQSLFDSDFYNIITNDLKILQCPEFAIKIVKLIHKIYEILLNSDLQIKFIDILCDVYLFDHIAKIICNSKQSLFEIRNFMNTMVYSMISNICFDRKAFISSLSRFVLGTLHRRHMFMSIINLDTFMILASRGTMPKFDKNNIIMPILYIKSPIDISAWLEIPDISKTKYTIPLMSLKLITFIICEMKRYNISMPHDIQDINKIIHNVNIAMKSL